MFRSTYYCRCHFMYFYSFLRCVWVGEVSLLFDSIADWFWFVSQNEYTFLHTSQIHFYACFMRIDWNLVVGSCHWSINNYKLNSFFFLSSFCVSFQSNSLYRFQWFAFKSIDHHYLLHAHTYTLSISPIELWKFGSISIETERERKKNTQQNLSPLKLSVSLRWFWLSLSFCLLNIHQPGCQTK